MKTRLVAAALLTVVANCGDSGLSDVPINELSDAELDELCEEHVERLESSSGDQRLWCLVESNFQDEASCAAAVAFCVNGPAPQAARVGCSHQPAERVTCEKTSSELLSACKRAVSLEDALRGTRCEPGDNWMSFVNRVTIRRGGLCERGPDCDFVFIIGLRGFFPADAGTATGPQIDPTQP